MFVLLNLLELTTDVLFYRVSKRKRGGIKCKLVPVLNYIPRDEEVGSWKSNSIRYDLTHTGK